MSDGCYFCQQAGEAHLTGCPDELPIGDERTKRINEFNAAKEVFVLGLATSDPISMTSVAFRLGLKSACREREQLRKAPPTPRMISAFI